MPELDVILRGGLPENRLHLIEGAPGTGKTTIAIRYLLNGLGKKKRCLYVTLSESVEELITAASTHGWNLDGIELFELIPDEAHAERQQTVLFPAEVEFGKTISRLMERIEQVNPDRLVIDSIAEVRMLAQDPLQFRLQLLTLKRFLQGRKITTLLLDDLAEDDQGDLHNFVHGVVSLRSFERDYGAARRRMRISKMRGVDIMSGWHDYALATGEVLVFPSLIAEEHESDVQGPPLTSVFISLNDMLPQGLDRGTTTMLIGPSGAAKSTIALSYVLSAVADGEATSLFSFDETYETFLRRSKSINLDPEKAIQEERFFWHRINPSRISPGEFVWQVRRDVEDRNVRVVVIDSVNSYLNTMPEEQSLILHLHELLSYLNKRGIVTILVLAQQGVVGDVENPIDLSFLSDTVILCRFFEAAGRLRRAISIIKRRTGAHDMAIHEYQLSSDGLEIGPALEALNAIFTGAPTYTGAAEELLAIKSNNNHGR
ncbi:ATPase domain-containing protein [Caballeronia sp. LZ001]|uniref:ATPase domain-containing protein n=1 Tax=Caballeronia sp. LZ001 TaxID=3038553 RepID=UPI0028559A04|nr:ATPase domain-containing protein [Caballeronia sp. LZ001]MDR5806455.1 ATPase domain-containing protein [Caballeronia sp. LZ001]